METEDVDEFTGMARGVQGECLALLQVSQRWWEELGVPGSVVG